MAFTKKMIKDKFRDFKKIFKQNWRLYKQNKLGIAGIIILIFFLFMAIFAPVLTDRHPTQWTAPNKDMFDAEQLWTTENWDANGPSKIYGIPAFEKSNNPSSFYIVGEDGGDARLYWVYPQKNTAPDLNYVRLEGKGTSMPQVYPEKGDTDESFQYIWDERVYVGTDAGILYRVERDNSNKLDIVWEFDLNEKLEGNTSVSIEHTPVINEVRGETNYIRIIVTTENSVHAVKDTNLGLDDPVLVWNQTFEDVLDDTSELILNQPDLFKTPKGEGLTGTQTVIFTTETGDMLYLYCDNGTVIWNFNIEEVTNSDVELTQPIIPFDIKKGESASQFFYTAGDDGRIYIIPSNRTIDIDKLGVDNIADVEEDAELTTPTVRSNGNGVWIGANKGGVGTVYYIARDELTTAPEERIASWSFRLTGPVSGRIYFLDGKERVYTAAEGGNVYCLEASKMGTQLVWTVDVGGAPKNVVAMPGNMVEGALNPAVAIIHEEDRSGETIYTGGMEGWEAQGAFLAPLKPSWASDVNQKESYILGTDNQGRDIFSQLVHGSRIALIVGFAAAFFAVAIGTSIGITAGYIGGTVDIILMRLVDVFLCMPGLALMIVFISVMGTSIWNIVFVIGIVGWPGIARIIRSQTLSLKQRPFVDSARVTGASKARIMFRHIAPNVLPLSLLYMTFQITGAILAEASLSYLGLGDPTTTSWGQMLYSLTRGSGSTYTAWWWFLPPGLSITVLVLGFFFISRAFDEIVNPRLRERRR